MNTWIELAATLENHIDELMDQAYPHDWDENYLSRRLLNVIRDLLGARPYVRGNERVQVSMESYKLTGKEEATFGDIGLLIMIVRKGLPPLIGAAYLEAKRRLRHTTRYPEFKLPQARRILKHAPKASLLLYDYEATPEFTGPLGFELWSYKDLPFLTHSLPARPVTKVRTVPLDTAVALEVKDTRLHPWGLPLSIQLVGRYLCGFDLEHSGECVDSLRGLSTKLLPRRLAVITVVEGFAHQTDVPDISINPNIFTSDGE